MYVQEPRAPPRLLEAVGAGVAQRKDLLKKKDIKLVKGLDIRGDE